MSGVQGHVLGHLVRRGLSAAQEGFRSNEVIEKLQHDAELYEKEGQEVRPEELIPVLITFVLMMVLIASVRYTVGEVIASLTMIESRTATAVIEDKPPAYSDEPDAPLEKEAAVPSPADADIEVLLVKHKLITSKITSSVGHLTRIGGFTARWRGLGLSFIYHGAHALLANFLANVLRLGLIGHFFTYIFTSVGLARLHMVWTHSMIAYPSAKPFWRRMVARKHCRALLLPSLVFAVAQQATIIVPIAVAFALRVTPDHLKDSDIVKIADHKDCHKLASLGLRILAVIGTAAFVAFAVLLPATVTLTRIEAALLPEGEDTIVPFDRQAIVGDIDMTARGASRAVFVQAWRSFDRSARWRLIKLYMKMILIQFTTFIVGLHLMVAELYVLGGERLAIFFKSASAQLQLMAIEAQQNAPAN